MRTRSEARYQGAYAFMWRDHFFKNNILCDGTTLYSYGHHFPMATRVPGSATDVWVNADKYSTTTSKHQSALRDVLGVSGYRQAEPSTFLGFDGHIWRQA